MELLTKQQAGDKLGISADAAYRLAVRGVLKFAKMPGYEKFIIAASVKSERRRRRRLALRFPDRKRPGRKPKNKIKKVLETP